MKILFISNHFSLPDQPGAPRPWKIAGYLQSRGHEVVVITNRRHYFDEQIEVGGPDIHRPQVVDGVQIIGVQTSTGRRSSLFKRLLNYCSFSYQAYQMGKKIESPDIIIVGTPPLLVPLSGLLLGKKHDSFTVLEIRDLYPETARVLGKVGNKATLFLWEKWENFLRKRYDHLVAVVPRIRKALLQKGFPPEKVTTISNGFDVEYSNETPTLPDGLGDFFAKHSERFMVAYGGGMGYAINLLTVIQAAELCRKESELLFLFFGDGEKKAQYIEYIEQKGLENVFFFPPQSRVVINRVFRRVDALVHSFFDSEFFDCAFPNKIFEYHGAGKPIVFGGRGDTADLIRAAGSGIVVEPENSGQMAEAFRFLAANPKQAAGMGQAGLSYISNNYRRDAVFKKWDFLLKDIESNV